jgi:hypothetical protein
VNQLTGRAGVDSVQSSITEDTDFALFGDVEEVMYESAALARTSNGDLTAVLTFSLLGLALSLLIIGKPVLSTRNT